MRAGGVNRGQRTGKWGGCISHLELRMHHLAAKKADPGLTPHPHLGAHGQRFLVAGVEVDEAQQQAVRVAVVRLANALAVVVAGAVLGRACGRRISVSRLAGIADAHQQLAPRAGFDVGLHHRALHLHGLTVGGIGDGADAGLVLIAQRQVQRQVDVAAQAQFVHRPLRPGLGRRSHAGRRSNRRSGRGVRSGRRHGADSADYRALPLPGPAPPQPTTPSALNMALMPRTAWRIRASFSISAKRTWSSPWSPKPMPGDTLSLALASSCLANSSEPSAR